MNQKNPYIEPSGGNNASDELSHSGLSAGDIERGHAETEYAEENTVGGIEKDPDADDSPIEMVRMAVSNKDDPNMPCLTFRSW
ncbi:hypothetical protein LPJ59_004879, partial [Coemansia sp. RSA 2399]